MKKEREIDEYDHLNDEELQLKLSIDEVALKVLKMNRGLQRFLSAARRVVNNPQNKLDYLIEDVDAAINGFEKIPPPSRRSYNK